MGKVSTGMESLSEDIVMSYEDRRRGIKNLKKDAKAIRDKARKFLIESKRMHQRMSNELKIGLQETREDLVNSVNTLKEDFRRKEEEVKEDLAESRQIWNLMAETLRNKRMGADGNRSAKGAKKMS
ncbi:MAG: hypothetical protein ABIH89_06410 [Elusimicrobiota bacterium]